MKKGINLSLTKSLFEFDTLLEEAIAAVSIKKLTEVQELTEEIQWKFQVGKYVSILSKDPKNEEEAVFWIGFGWEENNNHEKILWLEFDAKTCPQKYWDKINGLVGTSGKYCSKIDFEFTQIYMNAWVHFFLKDEYLKQFYDEKTDINIQKKILVGFITEVLKKL